MTNPLEPLQLDYEEEPTAFDNVVIFGDLLLSGNVEIYSDPSVATLAAEALGRELVCLSTITHGTSISIGSLDAPFRPLPGCRLKPPTGVTYTIPALSVNVGTYQWIDLSQGGTVNVAADELRPEWWGAQADGSTDDFSALQAALTAAKARATGAKVRLRPGCTYKCSAALNADMTRNVILEGGAGPYGWGGTTAQASLLFTHAGNASAFCISARSSYGFTLRGVSVATNNEAFLGTIVSLEGGLAWGDTTHGRIERCEIRGASSACKTAYGLALTQAISTSVDKTQFFYTNVGIVGKRYAGYSNAIQITKCSFGQIKTNAIQDGHQSWDIRGCTFEPGVGGVVSGYADVTEGAYGPIVFTGNWFGDVGTVGSIPWIRYAGNGLTALGNLFGNTYNNTPAILLGGTSAIESATIVGNYFENVARCIGTTGTAGLISDLFLAGNQVSLGCTLLYDPDAVVLSKTVFGGKTTPYLQAPLTVGTGVKLGPFSGSLTTNQTASQIGSGEGITGTAFDELVIQAPSHTGSNAGISFYAQDDGVQHLRLWGWAHLIAPTSAPTPASEMASGTLCFSLQESATTGALVITAKSSAGTAFSGTVNLT